MTKAIILDFDGTLADTASVIIQTIKGTIKELGLPSRTDEECRSVIGLRLIETPPVLFPECNVDVDLYASTYRRLFNIFNTDGAVQLYPNVKETLAELQDRGMTLTIASSRSNRSLTEYIVNLGLSDTITYILGADDVAEGKPNPEPVLKTLDELKLSADEVIVVGDTSFDIDMGRNAGTRTCGVTYGIGSTEGLSKADWLIGDFAEIMNTID